MSSLEGIKTDVAVPPRFQLGRRGQAFATRELAEKFRREVEQISDSAVRVLIDFEGVRSVSYSFADEFVGVLASRYSENPDLPRPVVIGLTAQAQRVLMGSLGQRGVSDEDMRQLLPH